MERGWMVRSSSLGVTIRGNGASAMVGTGTVKNGVIVLDPGAVFPDGLRVRVTVLDEFVPLVRLDQLPLDEGVFVEVGGRELAVFRLSDPAGVYAIDNACPHAGGSLSAGDVLPGGVVRCPWHAWKFRLTDGESADGSVGRVNSYPVEIRGEEVYVKLTPTLGFEFEE